HSHSRLVQLATCARDRPASLAAINVRDPIAAWNVYAYLCRRVCSVAHMVGRCQERTGVTAAGRCHQLQRYDRRTPGNAKESASRQGRWTMCLDGIAPKLVGAQTYPD